MKLDKKELFETIEACQEVYEEQMELDEGFNAERSAVLSTAIFKLQHQLKHLEDKEKYNPMGSYNPVTEFQKVIDSVKIKNL